MESDVICIADTMDLSSKELSSFPLEQLCDTRESLAELLLDFNDIDDLPPEINQFRNLKKLSLNGNSIYNIPEAFGDLNYLEELFINENELESIPLAFNRLLNLTSLSLAGNRMKELYDGFGKGLEKLEYLYLDENELESLPNSFCFLKRLKQFEISENQLQELPDDFGILHCLEVLNLKHNYLRCLPGSFKELPSLKIVDLSNNKLEYLPGELASSENLEKLLLENNGLEVLPSWCDTMRHVTELTLSGNELLNEAFRSMFCCSAKRLEILHVAGNHISSLSDSFGDLVSLRSLHLGSNLRELERSSFRNGNCIHELPPSFCSLSKLEFLRIDENHLADLPLDFGCLTSLSYLDLGQNAIATIPDSFCDLSQLTFVQLSKNEILSLPNDIGNLTSLKEFRVDNNCLTALPESFEKLQSLTVLDLFHNKFEELPSALEKLKSLKRLDVDENPFCKKIKEVPKIVTEIHYPDRDESLGNNWRGRTRIDRIQEKSEVVKVDLSDLESDGEEEEELTFNESALRRAMTRGISRWRTHGDTSSRTVDVPTNNTNTSEVAPNESYNVATVPRVNMDQFADVEDEKLESSTNNDDPTDAEDLWSDSEEDWDVEVAVEERRQFLEARAQNLKKGKASAFMKANQNSIHKYPPAPEACSTSGHYDSVLYNQLPDSNDTDNGDIVNNVCPDFEMTGQFDDAD